MMWNWLVSGLASGATLMLYDGAPFYLNGNVLFDYVEQEDIAIFWDVGEVYRRGD